MTSFTVHHRQTAGLRKFCQLTNLVWGKSCSQVIKCERPSMRLAKLHTFTVNTRMEKLYQKTLGVFFIIHGFVRRFPRSGDTSMKNLNGSLKNVRQISPNGWK